MTVKGDVATQILLPAPSRNSESALQEFCFQGVVLPSKTIVKQTGLQATPVGNVSVLLNTPLHCA